jgi:hypothetical protein
MENKAKRSHILTQKEGVTKILIVLEAPLPNQANGFHG